jgi:hypothetical protein
MSRFAPDPMCADCGGWDIEWMYACQTHKGVEYCRGCECPYCLEEAGDDEYPEFDEEPAP